MTLAEDLEGRAGLLMINPAPYNAEALPGALDGDITPTELHYVRSNFAVPAHDGTLEIGGVRRCASRVLVGALAHRQFPAWR
jgi:hypothetical protein